MERKIRLTENLLLKILADQSSFDRKEIAKALGITPQWLATLLNSDEKLSEEIKEKAARLFKISTDYFSADNIESAVTIVSEPPPPEYQTGSKWQDLAAEEVRLREEIARLKGEALATSKQLREKDEMIGRLLGIIEQQQKKI